MLAARQGEMCVPFKSLNSDAIIKTLDRLALRIGERFPDAGLANVVAELQQLAHSDQKRSRRLSRPNYFLRGGVLAAIVAAIVGIGFIITELFSYIELDTDTVDLFAFFEGLEAALNTTILAGVAVFALARIEERNKRADALNDLHELRSIAHVIDMHQLTKDPTALLRHGPRTRSSPDREMSEFELTRYLDYCAELLALTGKLAALYAQSSRDPVVINAVNDIETLVSGLSAKVWQKIMIVRGLKEAADPA